MDKRFPECAPLNKEYLKCFRSQPFRWGTASGHEDDACVFAGVFFGAFGASNDAASAP